MTINKIDGKKNTGSEVIFGTSQNDMIHPMGGSDTVDGRGGYDTVVVEWESTNFKITSFPGVTYLDTVSGASSADKVTLLNVESVKFPDKTVLLFENQKFDNAAGSEVFVGSWGLDSVSYQGLRSSYTVNQGVTGTDVRDKAGLEGTDRLQSIERIHFDDVSLATDTQGHAGTALKTLGVVFGAEAVQNKNLVGIALHCLDALGFTAEQLMSLALSARLGGEINNPLQVVRLLYTHVVGVEPSAQAAEGFVAMIETGQHTPTSLAMLVAQTDLNMTKVGLMGAVVVPVEYVPLGT